MLRPLLPAITLLAGALVTSPANAIDWQDNSLTYTAGNRFTEPANRAPVRKDILEFVHASGYSHGMNLVSIKMLRSDDIDPARDSRHGATEFYIVYRHLLSLGKVFDTALAAGPIRDIALTAGFDWNSKDNAFAPRKRVLLAGPTLRFNVAAPGFFDVSLLIAKEWNHCGLPPCKAPGNEEYIGFDAYPMLHAAWRVPFSLARVPVRFEGFIAHAFRSGEDYTGRPVGEETLMRTALMADVGAAAGSAPNRLFLGLGYELWRNKFGNQGLAGVDTNAPTLHARWHF
ncbi:hypothetical protein [Denitromonas iodatirespirans]|uniref:Uncharacterized protein n=1 Tax=Denitromonas iodatirespirans TaxID=2795389 RepID=A0A944DFP0_DENI1|nr:hypothetical protein [Denitromonas iodatirespirans]MBT0963493.1 hypothetical protein [Denitromonas iodatirespirans]